MKKIGLMYGIEKTFPQALENYINSINEKDVKAETMKFGAVSIEDILAYDVIFDRISNQIPFYRSILKYATLNGTRVVNNPFWNCADDNFFHTALSKKLGFKVPKTVILPSKEHPIGTSSETFKNLIYPLDWDAVFEYVGFPAFLKPNVENPVQSSYKVYNKYEFFASYNLTSSNVMILQEVIDYDSYFRCFIIGKEDIKIIKYEPSKPLHLRFSKEPLNISENLKSKIEDICKTISSAHGFDFNVIEIALKDDEIYTTDLFNPTPIVEKALMREEDFNWIVETTGKYLINLAKKRKTKKIIYKWYEFLKGNDF